MTASGPATLPPTLVVATNQRLVTGHKDAHVNDRDELRAIWTKFGLGVSDAVASAADNNDVLMAAGGLSKWGQLTHHDIVNTFATWDEALTAPAEGFRVQIGDFPQSAQTRNHPGLTCYHVAAIVGALDVPAEGLNVGSSAAGFASGVMGIVSSHNGNGYGAVGVYAQATAYAENAGVWAINTLVEVMEDVGGFAWIYEGDVNTRDAGTRIYGHQLIGDARDDTYAPIQPTEAIGFVLSPVGHFRANTQTAGYWTIGYRSEDGATPVAFEIFRPLAVANVATALITSNNQASQIIRLWSKTAGGADMSSDIYAMAAGDIA